MQVFHIQELESRRLFAVDLSLLAISTHPTILSPEQQVNISYSFFNQDTSNIPTPTVIWKLIPYQFGRTDDLSSLTVNDSHAIIIASKTYSGTIPAVNTSVTDAISVELPESLPPGTYKSIVYLDLETNGSAIVATDIQVLTDKGVMILSGTSAAEAITLRASRRNVIPSLAFELANRTVTYQTADFEGVRLNLNGGNDTVHVTRPVDALVIDGGTGNDSVFGGNGKEFIIGGTGDDFLRGGADSDTIQGGIGNDQIYGDAGGDSLDGGVGNDRLEGGADLDVLRGGAGNDRLYSSGDNSIDLVFGDAGSDFAQADAPEDILFAIETKALK